MNKARAYIMLMICLLASHLSFGQKEPEKAGRMQDGKFVLTIPLDWDAKQQEKLSELFDLDSLLIKAIFDENLSWINDSTQWTARMNRQMQVELFKEIGAPSDLRLDQIILSALPQDIDVSISIPATYGINDFKKPNTFACDSQRACFVLPGHPNAQSVYLSGSFNQWSTMQMPMQKSDSGWVACTTLTAGKYLYKFIVDGRWMRDPNNKNRERDGRSGYNSVVYCYNHTFKLNGYTDARSVVVAGSFNGFNPRELSMHKSNGGWELPLYLREGTHSYKFVVDGQWITDPANPVTREDGRGNINSFVGIGDTIVFTLDTVLNAQRVILAGTFNQWNTAELVMQKKDNHWYLPYVLAPGNYEYKFIADGIWLTDPSNPYTTGSGEFMNSFVAYKPTHIFRLKGYEEAKQVLVSGSFNGWSTQDFRMVRKDGEWVFPYHLSPGRYSYKFIVDGEWIADPANTLWETNEFGEKNSVIWVE